MLHEVDTKNVSTLEVLTRGALHSAKISYLSRTKLLSIFLSFLLQTYCSWIPLLQTYLGKTDLLVIPTPTSNANPFCWYNFSVITSTAYCILCIKFHRRLCNFRKLIGSVPWKGSHFIGPSTLCLCHVNVICRNFDHWRILPLSFLLNDSSVPLSLIFSFCLMLHSRTWTDRRHK